MTETRAPYLTPVDAEIVDALETCAVPDWTGMNPALADLADMERRGLQYNQETRRLMLAWLGNAWK